MMKKNVLYSTGMLYLFVFSLVSIVTSPALAAPVLWAGNAHYYEVINLSAGPSYTWFSAKLDAENMTYGGGVGISCINNIRY